MMDICCLGARYYDPRSGRFLSEDPIGFEGQDTNLYRFVSNNSLKSRDPFGLMHEIMGGQEIVGDQGIQMVVDSYVNQNNGDTQNAWLDIVGDRINGAYEGSDTAASAEHYLYAKSEVETNSTSPAVMSALVPGYQILKLLQKPEPNQTPASLNQLKWGLKGIKHGCEK